MMGSGYNDDDFDVTESTSRDRTLLSSQSSPEGSLMQVRGISPVKPPPAREYQQRNSDYRSVSRTEKRKVEMEDSRKRASWYERENERLKSQILRLVDLDEEKNRRIEEMEKRLEDLSCRIYVSRESTIAAKDKVEQWLTSPRKYTPCPMPRSARADSTSSTGQERDGLDSVGSVVVGLKRGLAALIKSVMQMSLKGKGSESSDLELRDVLDRLDSETPACLDREAVTELKEVFQAALAAVSAAIKRFEVGANKEVDDLKVELSQMKSQSKSSLKKLDELEQGLASSSAALHRVFDKSKRIICQVQITNSKKAERLLKRLQSLESEIKQIKRGSEQKQSVLTLYRQLTQLYDQNLKIIKQFRSGEEQQNFEDLQTKLEKGIRHQARFTDYISSVAKKGSRGPAMSDKYQKLWDKYRKQSLKFQALQKYLKDQYSNSKPKVRRSSLSDSDSTCSSSIGGFPDI